MILYIINQYAYNPEIGDGSKYYYLAKEFVNMGHEVYLVSASYSHHVHSSINQKKDVSIKFINGINHVYLKTLKYKKTTSFKRVINWLLFSYKLTNLYKFIKAKPDIIIVSSPPPIIFLGAYKLAKKLKVKLFFEIRDFWPLSLIELGNFSIWNPFIKMMQLVEGFALERSDAIISSIPYAIDYEGFKKKYKPKYYFLPNGFDPNELITRTKIPYNISTLIPKRKFIVGYIGSCGTANALDIFLRTVEFFKNDNSISFIIVGRGEGLDNLKNEAKNKSLKNIIMINHVQKKYTQSIIQLFDVCYIGWKNKPLYNLGVSPQKLPEYLISGKPIIHSYSGKGCVVKEANAGISIQAEDHIKIKDAILQLKNMTRIQRNQLGMNGKKYAQKYYNYKKIAKNFEKFIRSKI